MTSSEKKLVYLTTLDLEKSKPITDSLIIAKEFDKRHSNVIRDIEIIIEKNESKFFIGKLILESANYKDDQGKQRKKYLLNEQQTMFLIMGYRGKKAGQVKDRFIDGFVNMRHELLIRRDTRKTGKLARNVLTDTISLTYTEEDNSKRFAYSNYSRLCFKIATGMDVKKFKALHKTDPALSPRGYLNTEQLAYLQKIERRASSLVDIASETVTCQKEIYQIVSEQLKTQFRKGN